MVTQPNLIIHVSCIRRIRPQTIGGYEYRFVLVTEAQVFGIAKHWVTKEQSVMISDMERTIIDSLRRPDLAGGITEIAKGLWMKRDTLNVERLIDYALRLDVGAVLRRLGYLLEHFGHARQASALRPFTRVAKSLKPLDPSVKRLAALGRRADKSREEPTWKLSLNVALEIDA